MFNGWWQLVPGRGDLGIKKTKQTQRRREVLVRKDGIPKRRISKEDRSCREGVYRVEEDRKCIEAQNRSEI